MASMTIQVAMVVVSLCGSATANWHKGGPEQKQKMFAEKQKIFQPLATACEGLDKLTNCSASFTGVCLTHPDGERACKHKFGGAPKGRMMGFLHGMKKALMKRFHKDQGEGDAEPKHHGWAPVLGDCGNKKDGEDCSYQSHGRCLPTGRCPVFQGHTVCKPWDAHPPAFVTRSCEGKKEGDTCKMFVASGKCIKPPYEDYLRCKTKKVWQKRMGGMRGARPKSEEREEKGAPAEHDEDDFVVVDKGQANIFM